MPQGRVRGGGSLVRARARSRGGGLKGAVKVGNWENRLHAWNREKEMHQRAGRGAPVSRMAAAGREAGRRSKLQAVAVQAGRGSAGQSSKCGAISASIAWPRLFTISCRELVQPAGRGPERGGDISSSTHFGLSRGSAFSCLSLVGFESLFPFSCMHWMIFSRAPPIGRLDWSLSC